MIYVGTCGFSAPHSIYFRELRVIEIQKTFYTPVSPSLAEKWRKEAPDDFIFTLKAPQTITHPSSSPTYRRYRGEMGDFGYFKVNDDVVASWKEFVNIAKILKAEFIVFQTPASFKEKKENIENIYEFFNQIERIATYGWEPRGKWSEEKVKRICEDLNLVHIVDPFKGKTLWGEFSYYRVHGKGGYNYRYSDEELGQLLQVVKDGDYVMFNNTHMWDDALRFKHLLSEKQPDRYGYS